MEPPLAIPGVSRTGLYQEVVRQAYSIKTDPRIPIAISICLIEYSGIREPEGCVK